MFWLRSGRISIGEIGTAGSAYEDVDRYRRSLQPRERPWVHGNFVGRRRCLCRVVALDSLVCSMTRVMVLQAQTQMNHSLGDSSKLVRHNVPSLRFLMLHLSRYPGLLAPRKQWHHCILEPIWRSGCLYVLGKFLSTRLLEFRDGESRPQERVAGS